MPDNNEITDPRTVNTITLVIGGNEHTTQEDVDAWAEVLQEAVLSLPCKCPDSDIGPHDNDCPIGEIVSVAMAYRGGEDVIAMMVLTQERDPEFVPLLPIEAMTNSEMVDTSEAKVLR